MNLTFNEIKNICNGDFLVKSKIDYCIKNACIDSRTISPDDMFFAINGQNVDGHNFINSVINKGAKLVICEKDINTHTVQNAKKKDTCIIKVKDTGNALRLIAKEWRSKLSSTVIGITGSVGKTTTKKLCNDVLSFKYKTCCNEGNLNNEIGLPITICKCKKDEDYLITEMGMNGVGEIAQLCDIAKPNWGLITNIGVAHLEFLGSRDNIAIEKSKLAQSIDKDGKLFINASDDYRDFIIKYSKVLEKDIDLILFGDTKYNPIYNCLQVWYKNEFLENDGTWVFDICVNNKKNSNVELNKCHLKLKGRHNIVNACAAFAVGKAANIKASNIINALENSEPEFGRQEIIKSKNGYYVINDAYNANPKSMIASIDMLSTIKSLGKKIAFLGDMYELGSYSEEGHKEVGKNIANKNIDILICVGQMSESIKKAAICYGMNKSNVYYFDEIKTAKNKLLQIIDINDVILFKASNSMGFSKIALELSA